MAFSIFLIYNWTMKILTERLILESMTPEMFKGLSRLQTYNEYKCCKAWPKAIIKAMIKQDLKRYRKYPELMKWSVWLIFRASDKVCIGDIGFKGTPDINGAVEIGYSVDAQARKLGYGCEAVKGLTDYALEHGQVSIVQADCLKDNAPSIRILEKVGYKKINEDSKYFYWQKK